MLTEYQKTNLRTAEHFNAIYNMLKDGFVLLASSKPLTTSRDFAFAGIVDFDGYYFRWNYCGGSAVKATKKDLRFLFAEIFDDCDYYTLIDARTYDAQVCAYYEAELKRKEEASKNVKK